VAVASSAAIGVDGAVWDALESDDPASLDEALRELDEVRRVNQVADIFLFRADETTLLDLGGHYPVGEPNPALGLDVVAVTTALAGIPMYTNLYEGRGAYLKSAYAPVTGSDGMIRGGVGVEASALFLGTLNQVRTTLVGAAAVVLIGVVLLGAGFARLLAAQATLETRLRRSETLATMGQMAAMLAHEIRNPLGIIRGAAERIGERYGVQEDELFRFIPEEVDRLEATLGTYLDFARPARDGEAEDLRATLNRTLELMARELERGGIQLEVSLPDEPVPVAGEAQLLQQAFLNLLLNARDALPEGGRLQVSIRRRGARAVVSFRDDGAGMTEEVRRRATEPFFTDKEKGSGLGLAVVRRVVESVNGKLDLASRPGEGTEVTLELPLRADDAMTHNQGDGR
jgi:signal transduction histidine kinase